MLHVDNPSRKELLFRLISALYMNPTVLEDYFYKGTATVETCQFGLN